MHRERGRAAMSEHNPTIPQLDLPAIAGRIAFALQDMGHMMSEIEKGVMQDIYQLDLNQPLPSHLQELDQVLQLIEELSLFFGRISEHKGQDPLQDYTNIIEPIRLQKLRDLIAHGPSGSENNVGSPENSASGYVALF